MRRQSLIRAARRPERGDDAVGSFSIWHWAIVAVIVLLLFGGRGKLSAMMGDAAKGVKAFRDGLKDGDENKPNGDRAGALPRTDAEKEDLKS
jgi:sec-independent protein translocase protein TatA